MSVGRTKPPGTFRLNQEQSAFIESGVSIIVAARDPHNRPLIGRATGCVAAPDGRIRVFLSRRKYPLLLDGIRRSGTVAVTYSEPSTNKSLQVKSTSAVLAELGRGEPARAEAYLALFSADLERIGHRPVFAATVLAAAPDDLVAVAFTPQFAFSQTPGPVAGRRIDA